MNEVKAINTIYNGYKFRSRAEARWAILFDALNIKYFYEPEGFKLSNGMCYLPDFYLPETDSFFEVKGILEELDKKKVEQISDDLRKAITIGYPDMTFEASSNYGEGDWILTRKEESWLCKCNKCGKYFFIGNQGSWACTNVKCGHYDGDNTANEIYMGDGDFWLTNRDSTIYKAFNTAKQARFEHGETVNLIPF